MKQWLLALAVIVALGLSLVVPGSAEDRSAEVNAYSLALDSNNITARITALKQITKSGLTDQALFEMIKGRLLEVYGVSSTDPKELDEAAWLCKALASSGNPDYRDLLHMVGRKAPVKKTRVYARQSLDLLDDYAQRNTLLSQKTPETEGLAPESARIVNMLRAPDLKLKRDAAKVITRSASLEPRIFEVVNEELLAQLRRGDQAPSDMDCMAWLCKALGASGDAKYRVTLEQVISRREKDKVSSTDAFGVTKEPAGSDALTKYAKQSLALLK